MSTHDIFHMMTRGLRRLQKRLNLAGPFIVMAFFVGGIYTGWTLRELHDNGWKIDPCPNRWHAVTLVEVIDGDTIKVKWKGEITSVRLLNIDTPEKGKRGHVQAKDYLQSLLSGNAVILEFEKDGVPARDRYDRLLCYVWYNGKCVNIEMLRAGHSRYITKYGQGKYAAKFQEAVKQRASSP